ncbi:efflux RND transporter periplasmic adaptor subunit [Aureimonas pseudogalii]|uniref:Multidrug efflux system membrane fusion protein n=1 Tax=Aureimonas pseudogalii TaxID=1744844 RepID=A0A7W6E9H3_9HYPH|nr:efflux RND transporter periplasmic adaptor subunit [Aureimonas pseudogalii]MBB3996759.1 multidrug efflux system membrane fusion protein [Aureimonas pseudogalii]
MRRWTLLVLCLLLVGGWYERERIAPYAPAPLAAWLAPADPAAGGHGAGGAGSSGRRGSGGPVAVVVAEAEAGSLPILRATVGWVRPVASTVLSTEATGVVAEIEGHDGARVKAGDLVVRLDDRAARALVTKDEAAIARDQATLDAATASLNRIQRLVQSGANTQQAGDDATTAVRSATASLDVDRATLLADQVALAKTEIRASFDGRLGAIALSAGALVTPGTAIVTLTQSAPVYAEFSLPENDLDLLHAAWKARTLTATARPAGATSSEGEGPVVFIDNAVDQNSGTIRLRALLPNDDGAFVPGQSIAVEAHAGNRDGLVLVPGVAVEPRDDGSVVYVAKPDDTIEVRKVEVALRVGDLAGLSAGLAAGERVVTEGQGALSAGAHVSVKAPEPASAPAGGVETVKVPAGASADGPAMPLPATASRTGNAT